MLWSRHQILDLAVVVVASLMCFISVFVCTRTTLGLACDNILLALVGLGVELVCVLLEGGMDAGITGVEARAPERN